MRPAFVAALRNRVSAFGVALTTASVVLFLVLFALQLMSVIRNPYAGLVVFVMMPGLFVVGLLLIPIGLRIERRRIARGLPAPSWPRLDLNDSRIRGTVFLVVAATFVNVALLSMASYGAVQYSESQQFCGQVCHRVMEPEFVAQQHGLHARVHCVDCHVGPGAEGFVTAKLHGTYQLALTITGRYPRPVPIPTEGIPDVRTSCEGCHWPDRYVGDVIKVFYEYANDAANTATKTTVRLHVGGPIAGTGTGVGIHWHMNRANTIEYVALDAQREQIPYVRVATPGGRVREYFAKGVTASDIADKPRRRMECLDCHNRPAHTFGSTPERAVDAALGEGLISAKIPFIRQDTVRALRAEYSSQEVALPKIDQSIRTAVNARLPHAFEEAQLQQASAVAQAIYRANVFPSMKVGWGTYTSQLGHMTSAGCFRCHDEDHKTTTGVAIRQDCDLCHAIE